MEGWLMCDHLMYIEHRLGLMKEHYWAKDWGKPKLCQSDYSGTLRMFWTMSWSLLSVWDSRVNV